MNTATFYAQKPSLVLAQQNLLVPRLYIKLGLAVLTVLLFTTNQLGAQAASVSLGPSKTYKGTLNLGAREESRSFRINIPEDVFAFTVELESPVMELELAVYDQNGRQTGNSASLQKTKTVTLDRFSKPLPLSAGIYDIEVYLASEILGKKVDFANFSLIYRLQSALVPSVLSLGSPMKSKIDGKSTQYQIFELAVNQNTNLYRIDLFDTSADLDLYLLPTPIPDPRISILSERRTHGVESLNFDIRELARLPSFKNNKLFAMVVAPYDTQAQEFRILLSSGYDVPAELAKPYPVQIQEVPILKASMAVVEIFVADGGGSGCLVSPLGYILTSAHVLGQNPDKQNDFFDIGLCLDTSKPPVPAYKAKIVELDKDRDMALLKIERTIYNIDIPSSLRFPWLEVTYKNSATMGDPLIILGYPAAGGLGSRASITLSRGIYSGLQNLTQGQVLKTDASVGTGNSGGAALDSQYRLLGLPTEVLGRGSNQVAFIYPIDMVPESWLRYFQKISN